MTKAVRIGNFIIDFIIIFIAALIITIFSLRVHYFREIFYLTYFLYYFIFETFLGKTPGKFLTKTVVIDQKGKRPHFLRIILRTLLRFNPFDAISYLFGREQGMHDFFSGTRLKFTKDLCLSIHHESPEN